MNKNFTSPLLERTQGGNNRGGTQLTDLGRRHRQPLIEMTFRADQAVQKDWKAFHAFEK
jgi:molybdenum-dependent DNA-binding transcriptional regulator ModE